MSTSIFLLALNNTEYRYLACLLLVRERYFSDLTIEGDHKNLPLTCRAAGNKRNRFLTNHVACKKVMIAAVRKLEAVYDRPSGLMNGLKAIPMVTWGTFGQNKLFFRPPCYGRGVETFGWKIVMVKIILPRFQLWHQGKKYSSAVALPPRCNAFFLDLGESKSSILTFLLSTRPKETCFIQLQAQPVLENLNDFCCPSVSRSKSNNNHCPLYPNKTCLLGFHIRIYKMLLKVHHPTW